MFIREITLKDFRNYQQINISFSPELNIITGPNGVGKTNIIEAISLLSNLKSFRNIHENELIRWGNDHFYCACLVENNGNKKFEVSYGMDKDTYKKKIKIDDNESANAVEYYGKLLTVIFSPVDISLVQGPPEIKRRFIDSIISKINKKYLLTLNEFRKILFNRNKLLKRYKDNIQAGRDNNEIDIWDQMFAEKASVIINERNLFLKDFNRYFTSSYREISLEKEIPEIIYSPSLENSETEYIMSSLKKFRTKDIILGTTTIGPQRDDYQYVNSKNYYFINYASQGQRRTAAISLKIAENNIIESTTGNKSVILVDDVFSELDIKRQQNMINLFNRDNQIIFTMVHSRSAEYLKHMEYKHFSISTAGVIAEE